MKRNHVERIVLSQTLARAASALSVIQDELHPLLDELELSSLNRPWCQVLKELIRIFDEMVCD